MNPNPYISLVITQHPALVALLIERGIASPDCRVITHVTDPSILEGRHTAGILPLHLASRALTHTEIPLAITAEERASRKELGIERLREIAGEAVTYHVRRA